jgi:glyoxylase-like metal-dependent hydrolase (beta-lactamase superfamily II)
MDPISYRSFLEARRTLDSALAAHARSTEHNRDITVAYQGVYVDEGHYSLPYETKQYPLEGRVVLSRPFGAVVHHSTIDGYELAEYCNRGQFVALANGAGQPLADEVGESFRRCHEILSLLPSEILAHADRRSATLQWLGQDELDGTTVDVISFAGEDGARYSLYVDRQSRLLLRVDHLESHGQLGDVIVWVTFADYQVYNGEKFPTRRIERRVQSDAAATISVAFEVPRLNTDPGVDVFTPSHSERDERGWTVSTESAPPLTIVEIAHDLFIIELPGQDFKAPFAVFDEYIIAMEAPLGSNIGETIIDAIKKHAPGKPIRYLLMSHHHPHYTGGVRAFIHDGATLVTTPGNVALLNDYATQRRSIEQDRLAREPREPRIEVIEDRRVFEDEHHRLEVYDIGAWTEHTSEYLVYYVPDSKLLIEGDLASFPASGEIRPARARTVGLLEAMTSLQLDVELILQTWPLAGQMRMGTMTTLKAMVNIAKQAE